MTLVMVNDTARPRLPVRAPRPTVRAHGQPQAQRVRSLADQLREIRPAARHPAACRLRLSRAEAPDGRGLVASWSEEVAQWLAPVTLRARQPARPARPAAGRRQRLPHPLTRLAAA